MPTDHVTESGEQTANAKPAENKPNNPIIPGGSFLADADNAMLFAIRWKGMLLYDSTRKKWFHYNKKWWPDTTGIAMRCAQMLTLEWWLDAVKNGQDANVEVHELHRAARSRRALDAMVALAQSHLDLIISATAFDCFPYLLNCQNGTVGLNSGKFYAHDPREHLSKITNVAYDPEAKAPRWERFLREIFLTEPGGKADENLIAFVKRLVGYCVTSDVSEDAFAIFYGDGWNGKSTFITTLRNVLGDYAQSCAPELLIDARRSNGGSASPDVAKLCGARLVTAAELPPGRLNTKLIKALTGGDAVTARPLYGEPFEFPLTAKFIVSTNHKPIVPEATTAIWRRLKLIPFHANFEHAKTLDRKLRSSLSAEEGPGILRWVVEGAMAWRLQGLGSADGVVKATQAYRAEQNVFTRFIDATCVIADGTSVRGSWLYETFAKWAAGREEPISAKRFHGEMRQRFSTKTVKGHETYAGVKLADEAPINVAAADAGSEGG